MGQAWCKDKSAKAHDSKSPLDRVFVRCAHRIYPGLKEEGSVLGGATQRVTSSEIGYAGSPPRAALLRGRSIDSVDRPFHPSEWVDVNLEVPCTPRASVVLGNPRLIRQTVRTTNDSTPVPPPRRRRRRGRRVKPDSEPESLYAKSIGQKFQSTEGLFLGIKESFGNGSSVEDVHSTGRPKNRSTTSLPDVEELLAARRPARPPRTGSLPRDASLSPPQESPERTTTTFVQSIEEDHAEESSSEVAQSNPVEEDNSIFEIEGDHSIEFERNAKTSTPLKIGQPESADLEVLQSSTDRSRESENSSSVAGGIVQDVDRPLGRNEDMGYESRSTSHPFSDGSSRSRDEPNESSGILQDVTGETSDFGQENVEMVGIAVVVQRTISEESLPREMLVDDLDEVEEDFEVVVEVEENFDHEKSAKEASNHLTKQNNTNGSDSFGTPPPSPQFKIVEITDDVESTDGTVEKSDRNLTSTTPCLMELEAALTDMLDRKDEAEREEADVENGSFSGSPEPKIIPVKLPREVEDRTQSGGPRDGKPMDLPRVNRINPFNDSNDDDNTDKQIEVTTIETMEKPPEKPDRGIRTSFIEESAIDEPVIVPTPPRRRHRSKSNLGPTSEIPCNDRLI